ncbi:ORF29 [Fowl aviadenovirus 4]|uniref:ORF29 n=1 Tax=Fowl aviadenovirus 4 TaxID=130663 RepID=A0A8D5ZL24_FADV4|nr:ORF29 [Fowl aviadenovirus 4]
MVIFFNQTPTPLGTPLYHYSQWDPIH